MDAFQNFEGKPKRENLQRTIFANGGLGRSKLDINTTLRKQRDAMPITCTILIWNFNYQVSLNHLKSNEYGNPSQTRGELKEQCKKRDEQNTLEGIERWISTDVC